MITVLEIDSSSSDVMVCRRRRIYIGSVVYAMLKTNGLHYYRTNGREYFRL